jgi:hypothetical protein
VAIPQAQSICQHCVHSASQGRSLEPLKLDYRALAAVPSAGGMQRVSAMCAELQPCLVCLSPPLTGLPVSLILP